MMTNWHLVLPAAFCAVTFGRVWAQAPQFAALDIEYENFVNYVNDVADPSKLVTSATAVNPAVRNFMTNIFIGDIVSVNGRPVKGSIVLRGQFVMFPGSNPMPGQSIGDISQGALGDVYIEILQTDGTRVGTIMTVSAGLGERLPAYRLAIPETRL